VRNIFITIGMLGLAGGLAFGAFFLLNGDRAIHAASREGDALAWLQAEFHLDAARFAAIKRLHDDYSIVCGEHCSAILAARERRAPAAEIAALENVCVEAMTAHFRRVASEMQPVEGVRYLATVLPRVAGFTHHGAPNLRMTP
jgi:hypothetical protein